jgi:hypothetical protein
MIYIQNSMLTIAGVKVTLAVVLAYLFWNRGLTRRYPAMAAYLGLNLASCMLSLANIVTPNWLGFVPFDLNAYIFKALFVVSNILLYFICQEVFRSALSPFSGLMKFGMVAFHWVVLVSLIVGLSTIHIDRSLLSSGANLSHLITVIGSGLIRSLTILELSLLAFLCLTMGALRLSARDAAFGISLGFGVLSASDFISSTLTTAFPATTSSIQNGTEIVLLMVVCIWIAYFALPDNSRKTMVIPVNSTIYRWNEIATALGHSGTRVAARQTANGFFLSDVERVVEMVLARNLKSNESE